MRSKSTYRWKSRLFTSLHVMVAWFSERSAADSCVPERQSSLQHGHYCWFFMNIVDFLWVTRHRILILVKIMFLLFASCTTGSGINRPQIRIRRDRKYPQLTWIKVLFWYLKYTDVLLSISQNCGEFSILYINLKTKYRHTMLLWKFWRFWATVNVLATVAPYFQILKQNSIWFLFSKIVVTDKSKK